MSTLDYVDQFSIVMITKDRTPKPNYLGDTLRNLSRAGVFQSRYFNSFSIFDSGSDSTRFIQEALTGIDGRAFVNSQPRTPTQNVITALRVAANLPTTWVLFLEDDIDVCANFLESTALWLADYALGYRVFPLGANYIHIESCRDKWPYPVDMFYGTLAVAMRRADAWAIAEYLSTQPEQTYDLYIAAWAKLQGITHFLTPAPSFVQHIGTESIIRPGSVPITYSSWAGREWAYESRGVTA